MAFLPHVVNGAQGATDPTLRSQLDTATQLRRRVFIDEQKVPEDLEWDGQDLIATTTHAWLTDYSGQVVAIGRVLQDVPDDPCVVHIGRIAVDSSLRGTGVGRQIMALLEHVGADVASTAAPQASAVRFVLAAQVQAVGFYLALGYELIDGTTYMDAGIPHQDMHKVVPF